MPYTEGKAQGIYDTAHKILAVNSCLSCAASLAALYLMVKLGVHKNRLMNLVFQMTLLQVRQ